MAKIEVGRMALRAPDGTFLPSEPIYRDIPDEKITVTVQKEDGEEGETESFLFPFYNGAVELFNDEIRKMKLKKVNLKRKNKNGKVN